MKSIKFNLYRYQLLPKHRFFQGDLFGDLKSIKDLEKIAIQDFYWEYIL